MRQNLWLAVVYNSLAVPIAIAGLVTPLDRGRGHVRLLDLVMLNALRARNAGGKARPAKFDAAFASDRALSEV